MAVAVVGKQGRLCLCCRLPAQCPPSPVTGPARTGHSPCSAALAHLRCHEPDARSRQGSGGPGAATELCPARLPLGSTAGKVSLSSSLLAHSSQAPGTAPLAILWLCRAEHTAPHTTAQQGQQHTHTPSTPCSLSLQEKMGRSGVLLAAWRVSFIKMPEEAFGRGWCSP